MTGPSVNNTNPFVYSFYPEGQQNFFAPSDSTATAVTVPMAPSPEVDPNVKLDEAGNVPMAAVTKDENIGTTVETKVEAPVSEENKEKKFVKTGESVSERLNRYYGGKYAKASPEEKEKMFQRYVTGHFQTLSDKSRDQQIKIQLADYKKLLSNTREGDDYEMMAKQIAILEEQNQVPAAKAATEEAPSVMLKKRGEIGVAKAVPACCPSNQRALTDIVVKSNNLDAQKIGASSVSKLAVENQVYAHGAYFDIKTSNPKDQEAIQTILTEQLGSYDKSVQLPIYEKTMTSDFESVLVLGASNICNLDKTNQVQATQLTINTGNEAAMKVAYANVGQCAPENQAQMSGMLTTAATYCGYSLDDNSDDSSSSSSSSIYGESKTEEFAKQDVNEKIDTITKAKGKDRVDLIKELLKNPAQLEALIGQLSPSELYSVVNVILDYDLSNKVMDKISSRMAELDPKEQQSLYVKLDKIYSSKTLEEKFAMSDSISQITFLNSQSTSTNPIDTKNFSQVAREYQAKLRKEQNETIV